MCRPLDTASTITFAVTAPYWAAQYYADQTPGAGLKQVVTDVKTIDPIRTDTFRFNAANQSYTYITTGAYPFIYYNENETWLPSDIQPTASDARFTVFLNACTNFDGFSYNLALFNPGTKNDLLSLLYAGFGMYSMTQTHRTTGSIIFHPLAYGVSSPTSALTRSGTSIYNGVLRATDNVTSDIEGTLQISVDFAAQSFSGTVTLRRRTGSTQELGTYAITQAAGTGLQALSGTVSGGKFEGFLAGPAAEEVAGSFRVVIPDPGKPGSTTTVVGAGAAKR